MKKSITDLTTDIYTILDSGLDHEPSSTSAAAYAMRIGGELAKSTLKRDKPREKGKLWASDLGKKCMRQVYYNFNDPTKGEPLTGNTKFKFLYGNILEEAVLYMAEEAGHTVEYPQERVEYQFNSDWAVSGRIDAVVDGVLVDVKTTSSYGYQRYKDGIDATNDSFGYLQQLAFYKAHGTFPMADKEQGFIWIDKQNGHIKYTKCAVEDKSSLDTRVSNLITAIEADKENDVPRGFAPEPYGKSGNEKLAIGCAYCSYKHHCWRDSNNGMGLRTYLYGQGPIDFTEVTREPRCPEITKTK